MRIDIITVLPELMRSPFEASIMKRAIQKGLVEVHFHNLRDYTTNKQRSVDDYQFGGGAGMAPLRSHVLHLLNTLKITDRKKELFKTSGGKYVAPQPIENKLKESPFVEQVMVVGSERKFVGALIVPSFATLKEWMREKEIPYTTNEDVIHHPKVLRRLS